MVAERKEISKQKDRRNRIKSSWYYTEIEI